MHLIRAANLCVADVVVSTALYRDHLAYRVVEEGTISPALAAGWAAPAAADARYSVMQPQSGAPVFLRFIEQAPHPDYRPLRTYGWAAVEICVQDVEAVNARMQASPFEIIGPPRLLDTMPQIYPMQMKGPDGEIVYLTEIRDDPPGMALPRAKSPIDQLFILVLAASDLKGAADWYARVLGFTAGPSVKINYTMLTKSFATPAEQKFEICTVGHARDVFVELDQYPPHATPRPQHADHLPPGVAMASFVLPDFDARLQAMADFLIAPPTGQTGAIYKGKRAATLRGPDGVLIEVVEP